MNSAPLPPSPLPALSGELFLTDGGLETALIFHEGLDLPGLAAFVLLEREDGREILRRYYRRYLAVAAQWRTGFILETATWRCHPDMGRRLGYSPGQVRELNRRSLALLRELAAESGPIPRTLFSGCLGPRGDGYQVTAAMGAEAAAEYHRDQVATFAEGGIDLVTAMTIPYAEEAMGIVLAARAEGVPVVISFTVETDGRLPSGEPLAAAVARVDAATGGGPDYYMVNCAHPSHLAGVVPEGDWTRRVRGLRPNASVRSHAELDESPTLDEGDPEALARLCRELADRWGNLSVLGGCCGTDHRHVAAIARSFRAAAA